MATRSQSPRVRACSHLIAVLNASGAHRVDDLVDAYSGTAEAEGVEFETSPESVRALLEKLASLRAIQATW